MNATIRIKPGKWYSKPLAHHPRKAALRLWYTVMVGFVPNGYKSCPYIHVYKNQVEDKLKTIQKLSRS